MQENAYSTDGDIQSSLNYVYDSNGNRTAKYLTSYSDEGENSVSLTQSPDGIELYTYNAFNQLTGYADGTASYVYGYAADGTRNYKSNAASTSYFYWDGADLAAEETGSNIRKYYYGADGIAFSDISGNPEYYLKNIHGDITGAIDSNGAVQQNNSYDAFGNRLSSNSGPFGYCGEYMDSESGLIYLRNRYYDTSTGTFITEDPIRDGLNWYSYCAGNPIMFVDPSGFGDVYLTTIVNQTTGNVIYNDKKRAAIVTIDGQTKEYYLSDSKIVNDKIVVDEEQFYKDFNIVGKLTIFSYWNEEEPTSSSLIGDIITGHAFLGYKSFNGYIDSYFSTWQWTYNSNGEQVIMPGVYVNREADKELAYDDHTSSYSVKITQNQQDKLYDEIWKNDSWSLNNTCANFAIRVFGNITDIRFPMTSIPKFLKADIAAKNIL